MQASQHRKKDRRKNNTNDKHKKEKLIIDRPSINIQRLQATDMKKDKNKNTKWKKEKQKQQHQKATKKLTQKITRSKF